MRRALAVASLLLPLWMWADIAAAAPPQVPAVAQEPDVPEKAGKAVRAFRITGTPPVVDGRLDEEVWTVADRLSDFVQNEPDNMAAPTERTVVQVAYDDRYLYVAARCDMRDASHIVTGLGRRDNLPASDRFVLSLDPRHDHQTAYMFQVNPAGVQNDFAYFDDTQINNDYDAVWEVVTTVTSAGWIAEYRIPFSQMRFDVPPGEEVIWGINFGRELQRRGESSKWVGTPRGAQGFVSRFGHLIFGERLSPPRRIEVLPFALTRTESAPGIETDHGLSGGVDLRLGLGTGSTLSAAINPDFGQVEQDPAVLNLTVFETFFPEKRAFFLEDSRLFVPQFGEFQLFHSRRIGQAPRRYSLAADDVVLDRPDDTTILGAAKLTSRGSRWSYGALSALTGSERATVTSISASGENQGRAQRLIEPLTSYNVARLQRDILNGSSNIGALGTAVLRDGDSNAFTGGLDYNLRWRQNRLFWNGHWAMSHAPLRGDMRTGAGGTTTAGYDRKHIGGNVRYERYDRDFEIGDLGFHRHRVDKTQVEARVFATQPDPWLAFRSVHTYVNVNESRNGDGLVILRYVFTGLNMDFRNYWSLYWWGGREFGGFDDVDSRGGPPVVNPAETFGGIFVGTDSRKTWRLMLNANGARGDEGRWSLRLGPEVTFQPSGRLQASISTNFNPAQQVAQWITNRDTDGDRNTDFVYGRLRQNVLDITARATYAFTRDLTLQMYLQPFVAVGDYSDIRRLARPRSFEFEPVEVPFDPDFNEKSLRGNVVLRWEYLRGSTLFVVWNTSTIDTTRAGRFAPLRDLESAFGGAGSHVAMVKLSYWLGR